MFFDPKIDERRPFFGQIEEVDYATGRCTIRFYRPLDRAYDIVVAQPYTGRGWGIFCGAEPGSIVMCIQDADRRIYIIGYMPDINWYNDALETRTRVNFDEFSYPRPQKGEIVFQSKKNARIALNKYGDVLLQTPGGNTFVLDEDTDTIKQLSAQRITTCDAYRKIAGAIKRDIRTLDEKLEDPLIGAGTAFNYNLNDFTEFIGFNPEHKPDAAPALDPFLLSGDIQDDLPSSARADIKQSFSNLPEGLADLTLGDTGSSLYRSDSVNPPLAEIREIFYEFSDTNVGLDLQQVSDELRAVGKFDDNVLGRRILGTVVNDIGKLLCFDYGFHDGQMGHTKMWKTEGLGVHEDGHSTDDFFDRTNTLLEPKGELRDDFEWTVETLERTDAVTMYDFTLRTRGVDYKGEAEEEETGGKNWTLKIAKDGLTKLNIPAATSLNANEFHREGRSLIANIDGSIEATIGKQLCTDEKGLDRVVGHKTLSNFVNMNDYPNYGRKDRSVALDLEGNLELAIGGDSNNNQSIMLEADGSLAAFFGKEVPEKVTGVAPGSQTPVSTACLSNDRKDRSITIRTLGNVEMHLNKDERNKQSLMVSTEGGNRFMSGQDTRDRSYDIHTTGGIRVEVQGPMKKQNYALELDLEGNMHIYVNGKVDLHSTEDMRLHTEADFHLDVEKDLLVKVGGDAHWDVGGSYTTKIQESENLDIGRDQITKTGGAVSTSIGSNYNVQATGLVNQQAGGIYSIRSIMTNIEGGLNVNMGFANSATTSMPSSPKAPRDLFTSSRESPTILSGKDFSQELPAMRESDKTGEPPVTNQLEETIDEVSNRIINPFEEE